MTKVEIYARYSSVDILVGEDSQSKSIKNQIDIFTFLYDLLQYKWR